jgi:hypothetical protein
MCTTGGSELAKVNSNTPGTANDENCIVVANVGSLTDVQRSREPIGGDSGGWERHGSGNRESIFHRDRSILSICAITVDPYPSVEVGTPVLLAALAGITLATNEIKVREDVIADRPGRDIFAEGIYDTGKLVARNSRGERGIVIETAVDGVLDGSGDPTGVYSDAYLIWFRLRNRNILNGKFAAPFREHDCIHIGHKKMSVCYVQMRSVDMVGSV